MDDYDIKKVPVWVAPEEDGAKILTMPNVPTPLHGVNPRTILGKTTWDKMRKACYYHAGYKCQACGKDLGRGECHAHELYTYNYVAGEARFVKCVCLCPECHVLGIHSGRALTMFKKENPIMSKKKILGGAENLFRQLHEWNVAHPNEEPLRAYATFIDYAKWPPLAKEMEELIKKYDVKFFKEDSDTMAHWTKWHLMIGNKSYGTPYETRADWEKAMEEKNQANQNAAADIQTPIMDEVNKILSIDE